MEDVPVLIRNSVILLLLSGAVLASWPSTGKADREWLGSSGPNWHLPSNWSPEAVPTATEDVVIDRVVPNPAVISVANASTRNLTVGNGSVGNGSVGRLDVTSGRVLSTQDVTVGDWTTFGGGDFTLGQGFLIIDGHDSRMSPGSGSRSLRIGPQGFGRVIVQGGGRISGNYIIRLGAVGGRGEMLVTGSNSLVQTADFAGFNLEISQNAELTIAANGHVNLFSNPLNISALDGRLNFGAPEGEAAASPGTLSASNIFFFTDQGTGGGSIVFNHTGTATLPLDVIGLSRIRQLAGTSILTGNVANLQQAEIVGGTLQIGNGGTTGFLDGPISNNNNLVFDRSDDIVFSSPISGAGTLTKRGAGTLILTANNTYSVGTNIQQGTLQIGNGGTSGSIIGNISNSGTLVFNRSHTLNLGGNITGSGQLRQIGGGTTRLTGTHSYTGDTQVRNGTLRLDGATINHPAGNFFVGAEDGVTALLMAEAGASLTTNFAVLGGVAGSNGLVNMDNASWSAGSNVAAGNQGSATLRVTNNSSFQAPGLAIAYDSTSSSLVLVSADSQFNLSGGMAVGGLKSGQGRLRITENGQFTANANSVLGPVPASGSNDRIELLGPEASLTINGEFTIGAAATYEAHITPAAAPKIEVNGPLVIQAGARLNVVPGPGDYAVGTQFTVLEASDGRTGTFAGLETPLNMDIVYVGNQVRVQVTGPISDQIFKDRFEAP